ncbi:MAG: hypothetical protein AAFY26_09745 [Cyanobacteria bacterium J06638_22]
MEWNWRYLFIVVEEKGLTALSKLSLLTHLQTQPFFVEFLSVFLYFPTATVSIYP